ncbi:type VI secretion system Vgr family protein [Roseimaritima ulvae]|uniref:Phage-related baseplate assembly protein n=1 Tax=Roseimaritima ulvae TaxID=980254 RepID=A0A5B9QTC2_9BACT|nr:type VI secretion system tip protein TssI/VgrG [Roseimaritima ulvae]QEG40655.1 Phage-related baseplate assembly protein [Roseimaritima ulvae]
MPIEVTAQRIRLWTQHNAGSFNLVEIRGRESLSRPYRFQLKLRTHFADPVNLSDLLGTPVRASFTLPDPYWLARLEAQDPLPSRDICGVLSHVFDDGRDDRYRYYTATMRPRFWTYGLNRRFRMFQQRDTQSIVSEVLGNLPVRWEIGPAGPPRNYCVQYGESDLAFVSRLLEEDGMFYFFEHQYDGQPTDPHERTERMVISDSIDRVNTGEPPAYAVDEVIGGNRDSMRIRRWQKRHRLTPHVVRSLDRNFQRPNTFADASRLSPGEQEKSDWALTDYPSGIARRVDEISAAGERNTDQLTQLDDLADRDARLKVERIACLQKNYCGSGDVAAMMPGQKFRLLRDAVPDPQQYYLTDVQHLIRLATQHRSDESDVELKYQNRFRCMAESTPFRAPLRTKKPVLSGVVPAMVVSDPSITDDDVCVDVYGRVKVVFPWQADNAPSCWIRVSQFWAGKRWGAFFWPRTGQEVLVAFEHGDPDRPVIVGSLYNSENMPPLPLPDKKLCCGIHSCSHKGIGTSQTSSMVFHDAQGEEYLALHSETYMAISSETTELKQSAGPKISFKGHHWLFDTGGGSGGGGSDATGNDEAGSGPFKDPGPCTFDVKHFFKEIALIADEGEIEFNVGDSYKKSVGRQMSTIFGPTTALSCDPMELVDELLESAGPVAGKILSTLGTLVFGSGGQGKTFFGGTQTLNYGETLTVNRGHQIKNTGPGFHACMEMAHAGNMKGYEPIAGFACMVLTLLMLLTDLIATMLTKCLVDHFGSTWEHVVKFDQIWTLNILPRLQGLLELLERLNASIKSVQQKLAVATSQLEDAISRVFRAMETTDGAAGESIEAMEKFVPDIAAHMACVSRLMKSVA